MIRLSLSLASLVALSTLPVYSAKAAEVSDVIDADDGADLFDFIGEVRYERRLRRAKVTREYNCNPSLENQRQDIQTCPDAGPEGELLEVKELRYERVTHEVTPAFRFGLWHDLELAVEAPIVITDEQVVRFAGNGGDSDGIAITPENSSIAPDPAGSRDPANLFEVPNEALPTRAGFGDMLFKLRYAPISRERDDTRGEWALELGYRAPTGEVMKGSNEGVGRGVHELIVGTALSHRFHYMDPYARIEAVFPFPAGDTLFKDYGDSQEFVGPGARASFDLGTEIVPFEDPKLGVKFFLDLGVGASYQAEGRDYSELFDALATGRTTCNPNDTANEGDSRCAIYNPDSQSTIRGSGIDGITTVEQYMTFRGHLGAGVYASKNFRMGASVGLAHETEHFMTNADIGKDLDGSGLVEARSSAGYDPAEHNPTYVPAIDAVGRRLRIEETTVFTVGLNMAALF